MKPTSPSEKSVSSASQNEACQNNSAADEMNHTSKLLEKTLNFLSSHESSDSDTPPELETPPKSPLKGGYQRGGYLRGGYGVHPRAIWYEPTPSMRVANSVLENVEDLMADGSTYEDSEAFYQDFSSKQQRSTFRKRANDIHATRHKW